jgi:transaldolase
MTQTTPTCLWNDSAAIEELTYSIEHGAVGATCNPSIAVSVLKQEMQRWKPRIRELASLPHATEDEIAWRIVEEISANAARLLLPIFEREKGRNGRLSIQTDPRNYRNCRRHGEQAIRFSQAGAQHDRQNRGHARRHSGDRGSHLSRHQHQCHRQLHSAAGHRRRRGRGARPQAPRSGRRSISATMGPVCTLMVGRLDDWLKVLHDKQNLSVDPGYLEWAGVAVFKKAYKIYRERGYRLRLLSAAFRNHMHWSEFIGGDVVISPPCAWQSATTRATSK